MQTAVHLQQPLLLLLLLLLILGLLSGCSEAGRAARLAQLIQERRAANDSNLLAYRHATRTPAPPSRTMEKTDEPQPYIIPRNATGEQLQLSDYVAEVRGERMFLKKQLLDSQPALNLTDEQKRVIFPPVSTGNCTLSITAKRAQRLENFVWIHFPKAGSSLATTLYHYACPSIPKDAVPQFPLPGMQGQVVNFFEARFRFKSFCNQDGTTWLGVRAGHTPYLTKFDPSLIVAMVRDPRRRLLSAYHYHMHATGMPPQQKLHMWATVSDIKGYINFPGIRGCQVKMMNGMYCNQQVEVNDAMTENAIAIIQKAGFVGDTEEWNDSICLFHAMFGGEVNSHAFANLRPTRLLPQMMFVQGNQPTVAPEDDPHDWRFYLAAKAVMRRNQKLYGMPVYQVN